MPTNSRAESSLCDRGIISGAAALIAIANMNDTNAP